MTTPRYPFPAASPSHDSAPIAERPPCHGRFDVYDALVDVGGTGRSVDPEAIEAARNMCATCLLRMPEIARACLDAAKGEQWRAVVLGKSKPGPRNLTAVAEAARNQHQRNRDARLADLRALIRAGAQVEEVCAALGTSEPALWKWCRKWGHEAEWRAIKPPHNGNQYRRRDDMGQITTRKRGKVSAA